VGPVHHQRCVHPSRSHSSDAFERRREALMPVEPEVGVGAVGDEARGNAEEADVVGDVPSQDRREIGEICGGHLVEPLPIREVDEAEGAFGGRPSERL
jgi:hypothetical protein